MRKVEPQHVGVAPWGFAINMGLSGHATSTMHIHYSNHFSPAKQTVMTPDPHQQINTELPTTLY